MPTSSTTNNIGTLLSKESINTHIKFARDTFIEQGYLSVQFVIKFYSGLIVPIVFEDYPSEPDKKAAAMRALCKKLRTQYGSIKEAIFFAEAWVAKNTSPDFAEIPPSQHPDREEAIVITGRDDDNSNSVLVVQRFSRNEANEPIWHTVEVHQGQGEDGITFRGVLDYLFEDTADLKSPKLKA